MSCLGLFYVQGPARERRRPLAAAWTLSIIHGSALAILFFGSMVIERLSFFLFVSDVLSINMIIPNHV